MNTDTDTDTTREIVSDVRDLRAVPLVQLVRQAAARERPAVAEFNSSI